MEKQKKKIKKEIKRYFKNAVIHNENCYIFSGEWGYCDCEWGEQEVSEIVLEIVKDILQRFIEETKIELREELAELEHKQWESWTKYLYENHKDRLIDNLVAEKWHKNWKPYSELTEEDKDKDRIWADKVLEKLNQTQAKWLKDNL